jgi:hypothetical protein
MAVARRKRIPPAVFGIAQTLPILKILSFCQNLAHPFAVVQNASVFPVNLKEPF